MGSLNASGGFIQQLNESHRNIGGSITRTSSILPNSQGAIVKEFGPFPAGSGANINTSQYTSVYLDSIVKITHSVDDSTVSTSARSLPVSSSGNPEIALLAQSMQSNRHTGNRLVLGSSSGDIVISRTNNTSFRPTS